MIINERVTLLLIELIAEAIRCNTAGEPLGKRWSELYAQLPVPVQVAVDDYE